MGLLSPWQQAGGSTEFHPSGWCLIRLCLGVWANHLCRQQQKEILLSRVLKGRGFLARTSADTPGGRVSASLTLSR